MSDIIDVHDLPDNEIRVVEQLVELLRKKTKPAKSHVAAYQKEKKIKFASWSLGVKGKLTREEIYDYL
ncbi:hypothetical protein HY745_13785 [Candidatus Desantisbacteria bacterium]|nr:hypothetical protein [Candidatus Desantisbacteria bacterium]